MTATEFMTGRPEEWALGDTGGLVFPVEIVEALLDAEGRRHALAFLRQRIGGSLAGEGQQLVWSASAVVKWVNEVHGGILVGGRRRALVYRNVDDASAAANVTSIVQGYCNDPEVGFVLAPYSTGLTKRRSP